MRRLGASFAPALLLALASATAPAQQLTEAFDSGVPGSWLVVNRSSPVGTTSWFQGNSAVFAAQAGQPAAYVAANLNAAGDGGSISSWLVSPQLTSLQNAETLTFYTRTETGAPAADRMQVRVCIGDSTACQNVGSTASDTGNFTTLLADINPSLTGGGYPSSWTLQTIVLSGLPAGNSAGRIAFRYVVAGGGPGPTSTTADYVGLDTVNLTSPVCPTITLSPASLPGGTTGTAYSQSVTASGGTGPYTYAITAGAQPTGLTLSSGGALTGTPTASGTFNFTVTATDSLSCTGSKAYAINVVCGTVTVLPASLPTPVIGTFYSQQLSATPAGTTTYAVTAGAPPSGVTLNTSNGLLSGTPTGSPATYDFTVTATVGGCQGSRAYSVTTSTCAGTPPTATVSGGGTICSGTSQTATISAALTGTPPWSVTWSDTVVQSNVLTSPATRDVSPASTTIYSVTAVSDANCVGTPSGNATVTVSACENKSFYTVTPCRVVDTRDLGAPLFGEAFPFPTFDVVGSCGVPPTAASVAINVTVTQPTTGGDLRVFPAQLCRPEEVDCGGLPLVSTINFGAGQTRANNAIVPLGYQQRIAVKCDMPSGQTVHFIMDVVGYFQ